MKAPSQQPFVTDAGGRRRFACAPVAVQGIIVNEAEQVLLLSHPERNGIWEVVSGAWEAGETLLAGVLREVNEEVGSSVRVRPLGTVHVQSFHYDASVRYMIGLFYLLAYEGGQVRPGDDMLGSRYRWWSLEELMDPSVKIFVPQKWVLRRAVELYRLWVDSEVELQPVLDSLTQRPQ
jgi:ADP-ribose pyrophosphatase YjhB (NUDIX family)